MCRVISSLGAEQLQLDLTAVKTLLLEMPSMTRQASAESSTVPERYQKFVKKEMHKVHVLLKVVAATPRVLVTTYLALSTQKTEKIFMRLMDLKVHQTCTMTHYGPQPTESLTLSMHR
jgi:vacuolar protein sorting-associated protein 53